MHLCRLGLRCRCVKIDKTDPGFLVSLALFEMFGRSSLSFVAYILNFVKQNNCNISE